MSAKHASETPAGKTKKFGKGERQIPHHSQKAKKYYPAEDVVKPKKVRVAKIPHAVNRHAYFWEFDNELLYRLSLGKLDLDQF